MLGGVCVYKHGTKAPTSLRHPEQMALSAAVPLSLVTHGGDEEMSHGHTYGGGVVDLSRHSTCYFLSRPLCTSWLIDVSALKSPPTHSRKAYVKQYEGYRKTSSTDMRPSGAGSSCYDLREQD